jgi:hypothetical protein
MPSAVVLPAPPTPEFAEGQAQLAEVRTIVKASTPEQIKQVAEEDDNESIALFESTLPGFDKELSATASLFAHVENDQDYGTKKAKTYFARKRPFKLDQSIITCGSLQARQGSNQLSVRSLDLRPHRWLHSGAPDPSQVRRDPGPCQSLCRQP